MKNDWTSDMSKKRKTTGGNPAKRGSARSTVTVPSNVPSSAFGPNSKVVGASEFIAMATEPKMIADVWHDAALDLFTPATWDGTRALINALVANENTPVQVLWEMQHRWRLTTDSASGAELDNIMAIRWSNFEPDSLPPVLKPLDWAVPPEYAVEVIDSLVTTFTETRQPACLQAGWNITKDHFLSSHAPNLSTLLEVLESNPASPADVVAEVIMQRNLN